MKKIKARKPRVTTVELFSFSTPVGDYVWPIPYDKKDRFIPSSVDCVYNTEYYSPRQVVKMLRAL
jgi:hypothetical protein